MTYKIAWKPVMFGPAADRPAAGRPGRRYVTTDTNTEYLDDGDSWLNIGVSGVGGEQANNGILVPTTPGWYQTDFTLTGNEADLCRFVLPRDLLLTKIAFAVSVAANNNDAVDVGIYTSDFDRIVSKGSTAGLLNSTGRKVVTVTATPLLADTIYYAGLCAAQAGNAAKIVGSGRDYTGGSGGSLADPTNIESVWVDNGAVTLPASLSSLQSSRPGPSFWLGR
jgi:hypothetical protein